MSDSELIQKTIASINAIEDIDFLKTSLIQLARVSELQAQQVKAGKDVSNSLEKMVVLMSAMMKDVMHLCTSNGIEIPESIVKSMDALDDSPLSIK